ncbi:hypothetical protein AB0F13_25150 [Streptomyces sp. NPDC026206]|uniref:hypothetical protein n=1 Tax=Streptomyces sp. NPDC026206 TaxID=3157089 RepID=UPI0033C62142
MRKAMLAALMVLMVSSTGMVLPAPAGAQPAQGPGLPMASEVMLTYSAPSEDGQGHITWSWTAHNTGGSSASNVVVTHKVTPSVPVTYSGPCEGTAEKITCQVGDLRAGGQFEGEVVAELPPGQDDNVQIRGRATWQESPEAK